MASTDCNLEYNKKEYAIVNDNVFFSFNEGNGLPPWLEDYIKNLTYRTMYELYAGYEGGLWDALGLSSVLAPGFSIFDLSANLLNALRNLEVAKNDYKFYVDKKITDDMAFVATLETLNASIGDNDATIKNLQLTYADQFNAVASQISLLTAKTDTSNAEIANVKTAIATQTGALAQRIDSLITNYTDQNSKLTATATAVQQLETFTGTISNELTAWSQFVTQLDAALTDTNGNRIAGSSNTTGQVVKTAVSTATGQIQTYSLYSNTNQIDINGVRYLDGFGMYSGVHAGNDFVYDSEFWVAADRFKIYPRSALSQATTETVIVYNPKTQQNETKKLIKSIPGALSIFSVDTINNKVEINGDLVVNGTITTSKIGQNSVSLSNKVVSASGNCALYGLNFGPSQSILLCAVTFTDSAFAPDASYVIRLFIDGTLYMYKGVTSYGTFIFSIVTGGGSGHSVSATAELVGGTGQGHILELLTVVLFR